MNLKNKRYIILEIIPTKVIGGDVAQISALKINGIKLEDRFDYRLDKSKINVPDILNMINYDNDSFKYVMSTKSLMKNFKKFIEDLPLLIIDNSYTRNYLEEFTNIPDIEYKLKQMQADFKDENSYMYDLRQRARNNRANGNRPSYPPTPAEIYAADSPT